MSEIRLTWEITQPLSGGYSSAYLSLMVTQPLTAGYSAIRLSNVIPQPLTGGYSQIRLAEIICQALFPATEELPVSTIPFPGFGNSTIDPTKPAAADPFNTALPGLAMSVKKKPAFKTRISEAANGNEVRNSLAEYPRWNFELSYEFLKDPAIGESSLKVIMGFFLARRGSFDSWLFKDPDDYLVVGGYCGEADGVTTEFPLCRTMGEFHEKVGQVDDSNTISIYVDGDLVDPGDYTITLPNLVVFDSAPSSGDVTADFQFFFACRFNEDEMDFEKFMDRLWELQSCEFRSIIQ